MHEWTFGELGGTLGEDLGGAGRLIVSTHGGTGVTPPPVVEGCRGIDDVLPPPPGHRGREHHCNATHGVGSLFWPELFKLMRSKMRTNAAPDAIVYNYMLHYAISDKLCTSEYADYWRFAMRSVRAVPLAASKLAQQSTRRGLGLPASRAQPLCHPQPSSRSHSLACS